MIKHHYAFEAICKMKKFDLDQTREAISVQFRERWLISRRFQNDFGW